MTEERPPDPNDPLTSNDPSPDNDDTDWGADWESAFQAEDDMFFSESGEDFFLHEDSADKKPKDSEQLASSLEKTLESLPEEKGAERRLIPSLFSLAMLPALFRGLAAAFAKLARLGQALFQRFRALSLSWRIGVIAGAVLLVIGTGVLFFALTGTPPATEQAGLTAPGGEPVLPQPGPPPGELTEKAKKILAAIPESQEKVRKKWVLPAFFIPVSSDRKGGPPVSFLSIDITLTALVKKGEEPPREKEVFVRDIIYQFFLNRPLSELHRYSLARGEMQRNLRAWLHKQWPDSPIEAITFNHYRLS